MQNTSDTTELLSRDEQIQPTSTDYASARALPKGTILNKQYMVESILGEGGFGITYLCFDQYLKIHVAVKEYFPAQFATRNTLQGNHTISVISGEREALYKKGLKDYEYEANRLTKFSDLEGIVSVLNFFYENQTAYMVMEYIDGVSLKEYLRQRGERLPWQEVLAMMHPVISSLQRIHEAGIIHRDISPDNIMVDRNHKLTIIDFGSARNAEDEKSKTIMLKKGYAPPEQYYKDGKQGPWTDIYALCATMYRTITGAKLPESLSMQTANIRYTPIRAYVPDMPAYVENTINRGVEVEIRNRIQNAESLEACLYKGQKLSISPKLKKTILKWSLVAAGIIALAIIAVNLDHAAKERKSAQKEEMVDMDSGDISEIVSASASEQRDTEEETVEDHEEISEDIPEQFQSLPELTADQLEYENNDEGLVVTKTASNVTACAFPVDINGAPVNGINGVGANVTSVYIPNGITSIGDGAFRNCVYLESIYIPASVSSIASNAFDNCLSLKDIVVSPNNSSYYIQDQGLYDTNGNMITQMR